MKARTWMGSRLTLALAGFALTLGCASDVEQTNGASESAIPAEVAPAAAPLAEAAPAAPAADQEPIQTIAPQAVENSPGIAEVVKLAQANVEEEVILAYIESSAIAYDPSADEILYLRDIGISPKVIAALVHHGRVLKEQAGRVAGATAVGPTKGPVAPGGNMTSTPALGAIQAPAPPVLPPAASPDVPPALPAPPPTGPPVVYAPEPQAPPVAYSPPPPVPSVDYFYDSLAPYGTWMEVPDYGWGWQPTVVEVLPEWRPYADHGRWLYTDAGWYWQSDYSWGWAPFHYGRWLHRAHRGWVWFPDTVWGPSWVCWRRSPMYAGWAPLPPTAYYRPGFGLAYNGLAVGAEFDFGLGWSTFTFVSYRHFHDLHPHGYFLPSGQAHLVYDQSTVANHYFIGPNNVVINEGIGRDRVAAFARSEIRKVFIRDLPPAPGKIIKPDRLERAGNAMVIYRPTLPASLPRTPSILAARGPADLRNVSTKPSASAPLKLLEPPNRRVTAPPASPAPETKLASVNRLGPTESATHSLVGSVPVTRVAPSRPAATTERQPVSISPGLAYRSLYPNLAAQPAPSPAAAKPSAAAPPVKVVDTKPRWTGWPNTSQPSTVAPLAPRTFDPATSVGGRSELLKPAASPSMPSRAPWQPSISQPGWSGSPSGRLLPSAAYQPAPVQANPGAQWYQPGMTAPSPGGGRLAPTISVPGRAETPARPAFVNPAPAYRAPAYQAPVYAPAPATRYTPPSAYTPPAPSYRSVETPAARAPQPSIQVRSYDSPPSRSAPAPAVAPVSRSDPSRDKK